MELVLGNIMARQGTIPVAGAVPGHTHNFDHVTACRAGRIRIKAWRDGEVIAETVLEMGDVALILAGCEHTLIQEPGVPPLVQRALDDLRDRLMSALPDASETISGLYNAVVEAQGDVPALYSCLYAHRTPQGDVTQTYTGWPEAYR